VLVLLAAGGLWLYQESRVEGALVVVANTSPAPLATAARPSLTGAPPVLPASSSMATARAPAAPAIPVAAARPAEAALKDVRNGPGVAAVPSNAAPDQQVQEPETIPAPKPRRVHVRKPPKAEARAELPADSGPSRRQRREETLMQCRAHGYDDRQCLQHGCEMTRYGFVCKG
jgi:hypothetical protein